MVSKINLLKCSSLNSHKNNYYEKRDWFLNTLKKEFQLQLYTKVVEKDLIKNSNKLDDSIKVVDFFENTSFTHLLTNYFYYKKKFSSSEFKKHPNLVLYPMGYTGILLGLMLRKTKLVIWVKSDPTDHNLKRYKWNDYRKYLYFFLKPFFTFSYRLIARHIFKHALVFYTANATISPKNHINQHEIISNSTYNKDMSLIKKRFSNKVFFVGSENRQKGLALLLKAMQNSKKELNIIGIERLTDKEHIRLAKKVKLNIHGKIYDRKKYYDLLSQADLAIMPSYGEKQGKIQLEAMSVGAVPICSDSGGTYQTINNYYNGLLFKDGHWKQLKQKIDLLYKNKALYHDLQKNGLEYIKTQSVEKQVEKMAKIIKNYYFS